MGQTPIHNLPYPELADPADVPADIRELALSIDALIPTVPVIPPGGGGFINIPILDVGMAGQNRAGRQLLPADFTNLGLAAPLGLWNLASVADSSGRGRNLTNKGAVPFGVGINGQPATAAVFAGSTAQALYTDDTGVNDPLRIRTGTFGCWFRSAKRLTLQYLLSKLNASTSDRSFALYIENTANLLTVAVSTATPGSWTGLAGFSDVSDDRWHFAVGTYDGTLLRLYLDGVQETQVALAGAMNGSVGPLNVGAFGADAATAAAGPVYGRVDEAFVTSDVLTEEQVRCLYCAKLAHALGAIPGDVRIAVHRLRKGVPLLSIDFPSQPVRLHNFTAGALTDQGTGAVTLTANPGSGAIVAVAGADGLPLGGQSFAGAHAGLSATDAGLPAALTSRSFGCWIKTNTLIASGILGWGSGAGSVAGVWLGVTGNGLLSFQSGADLVIGPYVADGLWHFAVGTEDNAAGDGVRRKLYLDGRLVAASTVLNTLTLGGANRLRIGANPDGSSPLAGQVDGAFVHSVALTADQVYGLFAKGAQDAAASPKNAGDHVERVDGNSLLVTFDTLPTQHTIDLGVAA